MNKIIDHASMLIDYCRQMMHECPSTQVYNQKKITIIRIKPILHYVWVAFWKGL